MLSALGLFLFAATSVSIVLGCSALRDHRSKVALWWAIAAAALTVGSFLYVARTDAPATESNVAWPDR